LFKPLKDKTARVRAGRWRMRATLAGIVCSLLVTASAAVQAAPSAGRAAFVREAQRIEAERTGVARPIGLAFSRTSASFYVVASHLRSAPSSAAAKIVRFKPFALRAGSERAGSTRIAAALSEPINIAFDASSNRVLLLANPDELLEVGAGARGDVHPRTLVRRDVSRLALGDPQGMAVDPATGTLFVLDARGPRIVRFHHKSGMFSALDLSASGLVDPRGIAFDPVSGHLHVGSAEAIVELTQTGKVVAVRNLSPLGLKDPQALVVAPSGDLTDDPRTHSIYVADTGATGRAGAIVELARMPLAAAAADFNSSLVRTVNTAAFSPPSPDPSGLAYVPATQRLVISDAEVEETVSGITHFRGVNVWETTLAGHVVVTANISKKAPTAVPMSNEATGMAWSPSNGHYFVSDDGAKRVFDLHPGADGKIGTAGDTWTSFSTTANGNTNADPEGITYDTIRNRLFVADGVNAEVYEYMPAGTLVGHFDVARYGVGDPETVEYNAARGTLFILSNRKSGPLIVETTIGGALLQTISVSAAGARKPAGLAYAPASNGSGATRFYFVDRGVDNNSNPNAVDGKMYEMTAP